ncbi:MAG: hypothetical protein B7O98_04810 [Zestosphaera tikiterensis]|uniref:Uncharacterized protein n=1 Tax=Zestosphaera tikiterensis TaxID=1973259 RepID=A0A2R7Y5L8_9CREN|nr:MAG: hypothetical protein B7O98_04810 [Zestosphaera tikiterensis]
MSEGERLLEYFLRNELLVVNSHLAVKRKTLKELLKEEYPHVLTRDGGLHMFRKSELMYAYELLKEDADKLLLPIYVELIPEMSQTTALVSDPIAIKLLSKILETPEEYPLYLYPIQLNVLRSKIGTLIQYLISPKSLEVEPLSEELTRF